MTKKPDIELTLQAHASSLNKYSSLLGVDLADRGPVEIRSKLTTGKDGYRLTNIDSRLGVNDFSGSLVFNTAEKIPRIRASLISRRLDLEKLIIKEDPEPEEMTKDSATAFTSNNPESESVTPIPINLEWMNSLNAELDLIIDHMVLKEYSAYENKFSMRLEGGNLKVSRQTSKVGSGNFDWSMEIAHDETPTRYHFKGDADNVELAELLTLPPGVIEEGLTSGTVLLVSEGDTLEELLANLHGGILISMGPAGIYDAGLSLVSGAFLSGILRGVSTTDEQGFTGYDCGIFGVAFKNGVATIDNSMTLQSKRFNVTANGAIDLRKRTVKLHIRPRAKKGFGWSVSALTGGFQISGDLASPKVKLNVGGITLTLLLGILRGPLDRITAGNFSCDKVLQNIADSLEETGHTDRVHAGVWEGLLKKLDR